MLMRARDTTARVLEEVAMEGDVHADDGDCRLGPQAGGNATGARQGYGVEDAGVVAEVCFGVFEFGFGGAVQAFDGYGAGGVVQGGE